MTWNPYENLPPAASFSLTSTDLKDGEKLAMPQVSGVFGEIGVVRKDHGDRFADMVDFSDGQDRLVVEGGPVIGIRNDLEHVLAGVDRVDARDLTGATHVD